MFRLTLIITLALLVSSTGFAHDPPGPVLHCQSPADSLYHDYLSPSGDGAIVYGDGNINDCDGAMRPASDPSCGSPTGKPAWDAIQALRCGSATPVDYDGEHDHAYGGALLAAWTGDGETGGAAYCHGMTAHHGTVVFAAEWPSGRGPALTVLSDWGRPEASPTEASKCGDSIVEPCSPSPPPSDAPFPVGTALDTVNALAHEITSSLGCNPLDCAEDAPGNAGGPTTLSLGCGPGADGVFVVVVRADPNRSDAASVGHIWTS